MLTVRVLVYPSGHPDRHGDTVVKLEGFEK